MFDVRSATSSPARRRAIAAFVAAALGVLLATVTPWVGPAAYFAGACVAVAMAMLRSGWTTRVGLWAAVLLNTAGVTTVHWSPWPDGSLAAALPASPEPPALIRVRGVVETSPEVWRPTPGTLEAFSSVAREPGASFRLRLTQALTRDGRWERVGGVLFVSGPASIAGDGGLRAGDTIDRLVLARAPTPSAWPRSPLALSALNDPVANRRMEAGVIGSARMNDARPGTGVAQGGATSPIASLRATLTRARGVIHDRARRAILGPDGDEAHAAHTDRPARAILAALVLGEASPELTPVRDAFARTGLAHLLAISGFHVAVMASVALVAVRLTGERGWFEPLLVALLIACYLVLVPARTPIVRAGILALTLLGSHALGRGHDRPTVLAWTATAFLLARPSELFSMGYQLSFGLVALLMLLAERDRAERAELLDRDREPGMVRSAWRGSVDYARATLIAWGASTPIVLSHMGYAAVYAVGASVLAIPLVVGVLWVAFFALLVGVVAPELGVVFQPVLAWASGALWALVSWIDGLPGATVTLPRPGPLWAIAATTTVGWLALRRSRWRLHTLVPLAGVLVWLGIRVAVVDPVDRSTAVRIDALPVGDGACLLVRTPTHTLLWDAGSLTPIPGRTITRALSDLGVDRIDHAIITHANTDHFSLYPAIADRFAIDRFWGNHTIANGGGNASTVLLGELTGARFAYASPGTVVDLGTASLTILGPTDPERYIAENDRALVAIVRAPTAAGTARVLLTGDIQTPAIARLLETLEDRILEPIDILELPHHGSHNSAAERLVATTSPRVVIQSTGPSRTGDPRWNKARLGRRWLDTSTTGHAWVEIDTLGKMRVETARQDR